MSNPKYKQKSDCFQCPYANAVEMLRSACTKIDGVPYNEQSCQEDMAMWAIVKIERLIKENAELAKENTNLKERIDKYKTTMAFLPV